MFLGRGEQISDSCSANWRLPAERESAHWLGGWHWQLLALAYGPSLPPCRCACVRVVQRAAALTTTIINRTDVRGLQWRTRQVSGPAAALRRSADFVQLRHTRMRARRCQLGQVYGIREYSSSGDSRS
jgi:hypothetical protein